MPRILKNLTFQVLCAVCAGILVGMYWPWLGIECKPLSDGFIRLVKLVVAPVVFLTIVGGVAGMGDLKRVGRVGIKALIYFEVVTTIALAIGLVVANTLRPGAGIDTSRASMSEVAQYVGKSHTLTEFLLGIIPESILGPFVGGDPLQVLFLAVLVGIAVATLGEHRHWVITHTERLTEVMFRIVAMIMRLAPVGAFGAMAFTIGKFGTAALVPLVSLMACVYLTMLVFIFGVLGPILLFCGVSIWRYLRLIRGEILLVLGTSSSESALPRMIQKLRTSGCGRDIPGLVIPAGYSFNLDGTSIYLSMAVLFIAQAYGVPLSIWQQMSILAILMLTSKGAAAVTGGGFVTLAATLGATHSLSDTGHPLLPVEGLALLIGVDRFMSEARAVTNLIGNGVATIAVARLEKSFDPAAFRAASAPGA